MSTSLIEQYHHIDEIQPETLNCNLIGLYPLSVSEIQLVDEMFGREGVLQGMTRSALDTSQKRTDWITGVYNRSDCIQFVILAHTSQTFDSMNGFGKYPLPVGIVTLKEINMNGNRSGTIGIGIDDRVQKKGIGTQAVIALLSFCKSFLSEQIDNVKAEIYVDNIPSQKMFAKLGFTTDKIEHSKDENDPRKYWIWVRDLGSLSQQYLQS